MIDEVRSGKLSTTMWLKVAKALEAVAIDRAQRGLETLSVRTAQAAEIAFWQANRAGRLCQPQQISRLKGRHMTTTEQTPASEDREALRERIQTIMDEHIGASSWSGDAGVHGVPEAIDAILKALPTPEGELGIVVVREPASGMEREHCCFCAKKTEFWSAKADVAVCPTCAGTRYQYEVPTKAEWIRSPQSKGIAAPTTYGNGERETVTEALMAAQSFIADGGLAETDPGASVYRQVSQALQLGRGSANQKPDTTDGG